MDWINIEDMTRRVRRVLGTYSRWIVRRMVRGQDVASAKKANDARPDMTCSVPGAEWTNVPSSGKHGYRLSVAFGEGFNVSHVSTDDTWLVFPDSGGFQVGSPYSSPRDAMDKAELLVNSTKRTDQRE